MTECGRLEKEISKLMKPCPFCGFEAGIEGVEMNTLNEEFLSVLTKMLGRNEELSFKVGLMTSAINLLLTNPELINDEKARKQLLTLLTIANDY